MLEGLSFFIVKHILMKPLFNHYQTEKCVVNNRRLHLVQLLGHFLFIVVDSCAVKVFGDKEVEDGVTKELKSFIIIMDLDCILNGLGNITSQFKSQGLRVNGLVQVLVLDIILSLLVGVDVALVGKRFNKPNLTLKHIANLLFDLVHNPIILIVFAHAESDCLLIMFFQPF